MHEVPVKIYIDKILKECRRTAKSLALLSGPVKEKALRAMADRLAADEEKILAANEKDVDAVGKSFEADVIKDRMKAAVARLRMTPRRYQRDGGSSPHDRRFAGSSWYSHLAR